MNSERDIERILERWLADGPMEAPDRVVDHVRDRIARRPRRRSWLTDSRASAMHLGLKQLGVAAAIVVVATSSAFLARSFGIATTPGQVPSPSSIATASDSIAPGPSTSVVPSSPDGPRALPSDTSEILDEGAYVFDLAKPRLVFEVGPLFTVSWPATATGFAVGRGGFGAQIVVQYDPTIAGRGAACVRTAGALHGTAPADVIADLTGQPGLISTVPRTVDIGGLPGRSVDLELAKTAPDACLSHVGQTHMDLLGGSGLPTVHLDDDARIRVFVLDAGQGRTVVVAVNTHRGTPLATLLEEAQPVLDTFSFETVP